MGTVQRQLNYVITGFHIARSTSQRTSESGCFRFFSLDLVLIRLDVILPIKQGVLGRNNPCVSIFL